MIRKGHSEANSQGSLLQDTGSSSLAQPQSVSHALSRRPLMISRTAFHRDQMECNVRRLSDSVLCLNCTLKQAQVEQPQLFEDCRNAVLSRHLFCISAKRDIKAEIAHYKHSLTSSQHHRLVLETSVAQEMVDTLLNLDSYPAHIFRLESNFVELNHAEDHLHREWINNQHSRVMQVEVNNYSAVRCHYFASISPLLLSNLLKRFLRNAHTPFLLLTPILPPLLLSALKEYRSATSLTPMPMDEITRRYYMAKLHVCFRLLMGTMSGAQENLLKSILCLLHRIHSCNAALMNSEALSRILSQSFFPPQLDVPTTPTEQWHKVNLVTEALKVLIEMGQEVFHYPLVLVDEWRLWVRHESDMAHPTATDRGCQKARSKWSTRARSFSSLPPQDSQVKLKKTVFREFWIRRSSSQEQLKKHWRSPSSCNTTETKKRHLHFLSPQKFIRSLRRSFSKEESQTQTRPSNHTQLPKQADMSSLTYMPCIKKVRDSPAGSKALTVKPALSKLSAAAFILPNFPSWSPV